MAEKNRLNIKEWQNYYLKTDNYFGNIIASVLQYLYKNKYSSLITLSKSIKKNPAIVLPGEGTVDLLLKMKNLIEVTPKFFITNFLTVKNTDLLSDSSFDLLFTVKCDFVIRLNFNMFNGLSEAYINSANEAFNIIESNNKKIILKYLLKQLLFGNYFSCKEFLEKEIFESSVNVSDYSVTEIMKKFNHIKYTTIDDLINISNFNETTKVIDNNIKVVNIPFTSAKMNSYFSVRQQKILKDRYNIGKNEINTKLLYLNSDYLVKSENKTVFEILAEQIFIEFFNEKNFEIKKPAKTSKLELDFSFDAIFEKNSNDEENIKYKNSIISDEHYSVALENSFNKEISDKSKTKELILKTLTNEKTPISEITLLKNMDREKLKTKKIFAEVIDVLCSPFLSHIIDTAYLKFLKQYLISNYGEALKENISEEVIALIEKKFLALIKSDKCNFIEYFSDIVRKVSEEIEGREYIVDAVIKNSFVFNNLIFRKYLLRAKLPDNENTKIITNDFYNFSDKGNPEDLVIIPYVKIKELLVFLATEEINSGWQRLGNFFETLLSFINSSVYAASLSEITLSIASVNSGNYELVVKTKTGVKNFIIKTPEDIQYIFKEKELEKIKFGVDELYKLHNKSGFGFFNKGDFSKYVSLYRKRSQNYYNYKRKVDEFENSLLGQNLLFIILKKLFFWFSHSLNEHQLYKISKTNKDLLKNVSYYYIERDEDKISKQEIHEVKEKVSSLINIQREKIEALRSKGGDEISSASEFRAKKEALFKSDSNVKLEDLDEEEEKIFLKIRQFLVEDKDLIFLHNPEIEDENVVIYVKRKIAKGKSLLFGDLLGSDNQIKDINTIDQIGVRYFLIKRLVKKGYLVEKSTISAKNEKKLFVLFLSKKML